MPASQAGRRRFESGRPLQLMWGAPKWPPTPPNARRAPNESGRASITRVASRGPDMAPHPPTLVAPRMNRGAPRLRASRAGAPTWPHTPQRLSITRIVNGPPQWPRMNRGAGCASINGELRRGGELLFRLAGGAREAAVHDLVEERLVAD